MVNPAAGPYGTYVPVEGLFMLLAVLITTTHAVFTRNTRAICMNSHYMYKQTGHEVRELSDKLKYRLSK